MSANGVLHAPNGITASSSSELPPLPAGLKPLANQLAGHKFGDKANAHIYGMLDCKDGTILKPVIPNKGESERYFYELVYDDVTTETRHFSDHLYDNQLIGQLKRFLPTYLGLTALPEHPGGMSPILYIHMVDATHSFVRPHILDIKIGAKAWAPSCSSEKMQRQKDRCPYLDTIKFQVLGARYYDATTQEPVVMLNLRKYSPYDLLHKGLPEVFRGLPANYQQILLNEILAKLGEIRSWFLSQTYLMFRGSSILIVFESDANSLTDCASNVITNLSHGEQSTTNKLTVKMIDFVHVSETSDPDSNYIEGISSLIEYFTSLQTNLSNLPS